MLEHFFNTQSIVAALIKVLILSGIGYVLHTKRILKQDGVKELNTLLLWAALPALIFTKITGAFDPGTVPYWWLFPFYAMLLIALGGAMGYVFVLPIKKFAARREYVGATAFQNVGYLPITLTVFVCSGSFCDTILVYIFLFLVGFNIAMWSFLPTFFGRADSLKDLKITSLINPPFIATILALAVVLIFGKGSVPSIGYDSLSMLGAATFPLALIILGAFLSEHRAFAPDNPLALGSCLFVRLIGVPLVVLSIILRLDISISIKFFVFLESMMPSAVTLIVVGSYKNADNKFLSGAVFYSHLFALVTIPAWLWVFQRVFSV